MSILNHDSRRAREPEVLSPGEMAPHKPPGMMASFPVTSTLIGMNVAVFAVMVLSGVSAVRPALDQLRIWGADYGPLTLGGQPWRLITSVFVHIGLIHLAVNMWALWNLGVLAEMIFGRRLYLIIYLLAGIAGNVGSLAWHPNVTGAGASGAIFGIAGAVIAVLKLADLPIPQQAMRGTLRSLVSFAIYNLAFGVLGNIDNAAHLGGFGCGLVLGALLAWTRRAGIENRAVLRWASILLIALLLSGGFVALRTSYRSQRAVRELSTWRPPSPSASPGPFLPPQNIQPTYICIPCESAPSSS
jgi:membrane associated rhomboid family serine protease